MAGRKVLAITERQFAVLRVLWEHGPMTVRGLMEHLPRGDRQPYTTVLGLLQGMEKAGLVDHEKQGLTHLLPADRLATGGHRQPALRLPGEVLPRIGRAVDPGPGRRRGARPGRAASDRGPARRRRGEDGSGSRELRAPEAATTGGGRHHDAPDRALGRSLAGAPGGVVGPLGRGLAVLAAWLRLAAAAAGRDPAPAVPRGAGGGSAAAGRARGGATPSSRGRRRACGDRPSAAIGAGRDGPRRRSPPPSPSTSPTAVEPIPPHRAREVVHPAGPVRAPARSRPTDDAPSSVVADRGPGGGRGVGDGRPGAAVPTGGRLADAGAA